MKLIPKDWVNWPMTRRSPSAVLVAVVAMALAAWSLIAHFAMLWIGYTPVFEADQWATIPIRRDFASLFSQHNEHRIFFPRLALIMDYDVFAGRGLFALSLTAATQALFALGLVAIGRDATVHGRGWPRFVVMAAPVVGLVFSNLQAQNSLLPFQWPFFVVHAAPLWGWWLISRADGANQRMAWALVIAAIACFAVAAFSLVNGVIALMGALVLGWLLRLRWPHQAALALAAVAVSVAYFRGFVWPRNHANVSPFGSLASAVSFIEFAAVYLGHPVAELARHATRGLAGARGGALDLGLGLVAIAASSWLMGEALFRRITGGTVTGARAVLAVFAGFILVGAGLTAYGRVFLGLEQAMVSRYATPALGLWAVLWIAAVERLPRRVAPVFAFGILAAVAVSQPRAWDAAASRRLTLERVGAGLSSGFLPREVWSVVRHSDNRFAELVAYLREHGLSIFGVDRGRWQGARIGGRFTLVEATRCLGTFDVITPLEAAGARGARIEGWAWDRAPRGAPRGIVVAGPDGLILGTAVMGVRRPDVNAGVPEVTLRRPGWSGYARLNAPVTLTAYAILADGVSACPLARSWPWSPP